MVRSLAVLAFIGAAAAFGIYVAMQKTVIKGEVMAATMMDLVDKSKISKIECDERIPVGPEGAKFRCKLYAPNGATGLFDYTIDRAFKFTEKPASEPRPSAW